MKLKARFQNMEITRTVRISKEEYIIYAKTTEHSLEYKFKISPENIRGFSRDQWMELTEITSRIIRNKFKQVYNYLPKHLYP